MKAISIRAPWWWAILHLAKDIENRDWYTGYRGPVLIHASKWWGQREAAEDFDDAIDIYEEAASKYVIRSSRDEVISHMRKFGGHIVGQVEIVACVAQHASPWFQGKYGFVLHNPVAFATPYPAKGALGFFEVSPPALG